ncbi:hypothetical protein [Motilibacter aurantiacus]|uniref:hypothetical protein n=1 Tax=Motilibacter aurantiacus TaxID=2714955 RepID=UPI0014088902|nr:hypothetical protein [Motilibacter aurantiacus]NHC47574.1 hypothetical protein [Motilibacter aurantiacus]
MSTVHAIALDDFGTEFGRHLAGGFAVEVMSGDDAWAGSATWPPARVRVVASADEALGLLELVDELSFGWRQPWLPVTRFAPGLRVGPLIVPGRSACFGCFRRTAPSPAASLPSPGLIEDVTRAVTLAAAPLEAALSTVGLAQEAGLVRRLDPDGTAVVHGPVEGVPGCPRCRPGERLLPEQAPGALPAARLHPGQLPGEQR